MVIGGILHEHIGTSNGAREEKTCGEENAPKPFKAGE